MGLGLVIFPALLGYALLLSRNSTRFAIARVTGYHLFFLSAFWGIGLAASVVLLVETVVVSGYFPSWLADSNILDILPVKYLVVVITAMVIVAVIAWIDNYRVDEETAARRCAELCGDLIELRLVKAIDLAAHVELSLRSGKSYIGMVLNGGIATGGDSDVSLIPTASGYRDKDTRELILTTNYGRVFNEWLNSDDPRRTEDEIAKYFTIVIPKSEIVSVRLFDMEMYGLFEAAKASVPGSGSYP